MLVFLAGLFFVSLSLADVIEASPVLINFQQNPSEMSWQKIDTEHFELIFAKGTERDAQRVSHLLEAAYPLVARSLEVAPKKISLILQNQSTISNGFVTLLPRRSEWNMSPAIDPEITNTEWLKTLTIHEFRHVVQFQKSRQHINKVFEFFLGEIGQAIGIGLSMPPWFLEGDAVGIETALTKGGRGRLPLFERDLRALLLSGRDYDYDQAHLGSFKNYIPNHYVYGYFYTSYMRNKHGDLFLSHLINQSTKSSYNPLTFYNAYQDLTGVKFEKFYQETIKDLIKNWKEKEALLRLTPYKVKNIPIEKDWTNYLYPQPTGGDKIFALKKGLSDIAQFVVTDGKVEETVVYPAPLYNEYPFKLRAGRVAWVEWEIDPRWGLRDYSRIRVYDLAKKDFVLDLRETKGRLAVLDQSGTSVLYVNWGENQKQQIIVRDLNGRVIKQIDYPREKVITSLDWLSSDEIVMVVKGMSEQKEVIKFSLVSFQESALLSATTDNLGFITTHEGRVLVESPTSGIDNIFEVTQNSLKQVTASRFGAYAPSVVDNKLIYNDYASHGMNVVSKELPWDQEQKTQDSFVPVYEKFAAGENQDGMNQDFFAKKDFPVSRYSQVKNSINLHSWFFIAPPLSTAITVQAISRDVMNKFALTVGANYDLNEHETEGFASAAWFHYYPVFDLRAGYGGRNQRITLNGVRYNEDHWEEGTAETGIQVPWKTISGRFTHSFNFRGFGKVIKVTNKRTSDPTEVSDGALFSPGAEVQYSLTSRLATRDINPDWGTVLNAHIEEGRDISGANMKGAIADSEGKFFLPGIFKHHSFFHQLGYEKQRDQNYQYKTMLLKPRGTKNVFLGESAKYSGNYIFPLFYPDWHASRYVYLKRVSMNLFYDDLNGRYRSFNYHAASTGWEFLLDTHFVRFFFPLTIGVRGSYVLTGEEKKQNYEIFLTTLGGYF